MTEVLKAGVLSDEIDLGALAHNAAEQAEEFVRKVSSTHRILAQIPRMVYLIYFWILNLCAGLGSFVESVPLPSPTKMATRQ